jgi:hypothetical protein
MSAMLRHPARAAHIACQGMSPVRMPKYPLVPLFLLAAVSSVARAEIYACVDQNGNKRFTNIAVETKGCKVLNVGPLNTLPAAPAAPSPAKPQAKAAATATPANFPRVDAQTQYQRDSVRRRILDNELGNEQKLLDQARKALAEQEAVRYGTERNDQYVLDRLEPFKKNVKLHEDNVASLRREMANMR